MRKWPSDSAGLIPAFLPLDRYNHLQNPQGLLLGICVLNQKGQIFRAQTSVLGPTSINLRGHTVRMNNKSSFFFQRLANRKMQDHALLCYLSARDPEHLIAKPGQPKAGREPRDLRLDVQVGQYRPIVYRLRGSNG